MLAAAYDYAIAGICTVFCGFKIVPHRIGGVFSLDSVFNRSQSLLDIQAVYVGPATLIGLQQLLDQRNRDDLVITGR